MTPTVPVTVCPHCGGKNGFITNIVFKARHIQSWDCTAEDTEGYSVVSETDPRCQDCGKSVRALFKNRGKGAKNGN